MAKSGGMFGRVARKAVTRLMDKVGDKLVSGMADTSADAPSARFEPKRDLYSQMVEGENAESAGEGDRKSASEPESE